MFEDDWSVAYKGESGKGDILKGGRDKSMKSHMLKSLGFSPHAMKRH